MALIINNLIDHKHFSLENLNNRLILFEYGVTECKNKPPTISKTNLNNNCIVISAFEMICLVRYFGLIVSELVPLSTKIWELYISLRKIVDICCARVLQRECVLQLDSLVSEHNKLFLFFSNSSLKLKFYFLTHYGRLLLKNGPISLTFSLRYKAKHSFLKAYANSIPCRINLGHTLSHKLQIQMIHCCLVQKWGHV